MEYYFTTLISYFFCRFDFEQNSIDKIAPLAKGLYYDSDYYKTDTFFLLGCVRLHGPTIIWITFNVERWNQIIRTQHDQARWKFRTNTHLISECMWMSMHAAGPGILVQKSAWWCVVTEDTTLSQPCSHTICALCGCVCIWGMII
jgi:hypothetical protein